MKLDEALIHRAVPPGSMRYYAWLYTPAEHRDVMAALFLLENELHDSAHAAHEVAHVRLQWWREEMDRLIAGKAVHPAMQVLQAANHNRAAPIDLQLLHQAHLSAAQELANATYETDAELGTYFQNGLGSLLALATQYLNASTSATTTAAATQIGAFIRQVETLRDLRNDFHHGRLYLPLSDLDALNIEYEALQQADWPDHFTQWLQARCTQQLQGYQTFKQSLLATEKQALRPLLVLADLHAQVLGTLASDPSRHTQQRVELSPIRKVWIAWRSARQN